MKYQKNDFSRPTLQRQLLVQGIFAAAPQLQGFKVQGDLWDMFVCGGVREYMVSQNKEDLGLEVHGFGGAPYALANMKTRNKQFIARYNIKPINTLHIKPKNG